MGDALAVSLEGHNPNTIMIAPPQKNPLLN
mgnify:FL=1